MKTLLATLLLLATFELAGQDYYEDRKTPLPSIEPTTCITVGILQGGGSLLGADLEVLLSDHFGAQVGGGLVGFGGGLNFHLNRASEALFSPCSIGTKALAIAFHNASSAPTTSIVAKNGSPSKSVSEPYLKLVKTTFTKKVRNPT